MKKLITLLLLSLGLNGFAQEFQFPDLSPQAYIKQEIGNTNFELSYSRPAVRGRKIFGELVPYGKVWRTGAAECNILKIDRNVKIDGKEVPPGEYSILTIPNENEWEVILNTNTKMYGLDGYDEANNILKFGVPVQYSEELIETFSMYIDFVPNDALFTIAWEHTKISFLIETSTNDEVLSFIENHLLTKKDKIADNYSEAADFIFREDYDLAIALTLTDYGLEIEDAEYFRGIRKEIFLKLGQKDKARAEIEKAIEFVKNSNLSEANKQWSFNYWGSELEKLNSKH